MMEPSTSWANPDVPEDLLLVRKRRGKDAYCWICHRSVNLSFDYSCHNCGRSFHWGCDGKSAKEVLPPGFTQFKLKSKTQSCTVCYHINQGACQYAPSELSELNKALSFVCKELKSSEHSDLFLDPIDENMNPRYKSLITSPMALSFIERKANCAGFNSAEEFIYDLKLIQHNSIIYNGKNKDISKWANALYKVALFEYCKISFCYQCYLKSVVDKTQIYQSEHFLIACNRPHGLVWAQKPNQSSEAPYELSKVTNVYVDAKNLPILDVCVFGSREIIIGLKMNQCFVFTGTSPSTGTKASIRKEVMLECSQYVNSVNTTVNNNPLCPIKFEKTAKVEDLVELTMDQIYLVKKVKSNVLQIKSIVDVTAPPSSSKPSTSVEISAIKRKKSTTKNDKNKLAKGTSSTPKKDALPFKIAFDPLQYQEFLPMAFTSKAISVTLYPSNNSSVETPQSSVNSSTSSSVPLSNVEIESPEVVNIAFKDSSTSSSTLPPRVEIESPKVVNIGFQETQLLRSEKTLRNEVSMNKNKSAVIKEYQERQIKVESESSECKEILHFLAGKYCRFCYQTITPNQLCCKDVYYCSDECKNNDLNRHYPSCLQKAVKQEPQDD